MGTAQFFLAAGLLIAVTYALRRIGVAVGARLAGGEPTPRQQKVRAWMERATVVLILGVAVTGAFYEGTDTIATARFLGVGAGVGALVLRAPLIAAIIVAMVATAALRWLGLP